MRSFLYGTTVHSDNKTASKFDIESAPCDKFCGNNDLNHQILGDHPDPNNPNAGECNRPWTCNNIPGWRATNRWMHVNKANITDINTPSSDHNGLDFLLLYNLYALLFPGEVENYYGNNFSGIRNININFPLQMLNFGNGANPALWISADQISSTSVISAYPSNSPIVNQSGNVTFRAGNSIILEPGFMAEPGVVFEAIIAPPLCEEATGEFHKKALAKPSEIIITTPEVQIMENPDLKITAFPNPFSGELKIKVEGNYSGPLKVKVFDMLGNQIEHREQTPIQGIITINTESLANGIYFVQIQCVEMVFNFKTNKI